VGGTILPPFFIAVPYKDINQKRVIYNNYLTYGQPTGPSNYLPIFSWIDGAWGGVLNLSRYLAIIYTSQMRLLTKI
jgi:hypothetical protein